MLSTFTPIPAETERKEPGIGGKPPVDRRPTGGGGGGGDDDWDNNHGGPGELLQRVRVRIFSILAADMLFFAVLVTVFFARRAGMRTVALPHILLLNTIFLLASSVTVELARRNIFREIDVLEEWLGMGRPALRRALPWLGATLALGLIFLGGQNIAWRQLSTQGFAFDHFSTPASYFFYLITGLHAAHLAVGVLALLLCLTTLGLLKRVEFRQVAIDATAWFWHTMNLAWVLLLALVVGQ